MTWHARSACLGADAETFFPARGDTDGVAAALAVCATCSVTAECLAENIAKKDGIYGATTGAQRRKLRSSGFDMACIVCGEVFTATQSTHTICSKACRRVRHLEQQATSYARRKGAGL